jgi:hypothetical protein
MTGRSARRIGPHRSRREQIIACTSPEAFERETHDLGHSRPAMPDSRHTKAATSRPASRSTRLCRALERTETKRGEWVQKLTDALCASYPPLQSPLLHGPQNRRRAGQVGTLVFPMCSANGPETATGAVDIPGIGQHRGTAAEYPKQRGARAVYRKSPLDPNSQRHRSPARHQWEIVSSVNLRGHGVDV